MLPGLIVDIASDLCLGIAADGYARIRNCINDPDQEWYRYPVGSLEFNGMINGIWNGSDHNVECGCHNTGTGW